MKNIFIFCVLCFVLTGCFRYDDDYFPIQETRKKPTKISIPEEIKKDTQIPVSQEPLCNDAQSCEELAISEAKNERFNQALNYFVIACSKGSVKSCHNSAVIYDKGKGVKQDLQKAAELYKASCDNDYAASCRNLGIMYKASNNLNGAKFYFNKACDSGNLKACGDLAYFYENSVEQKTALFKKACEGGSANSCSRLMGESLKEKKIDAAKLYAKKACDLGDNDACRSYKALSE